MDSPGRKKLPFFRNSRSDRAVTRRPATVKSHRILRSFLYLIAWIFCVLVVIGNVSNKPVLRNTYFLYLDLSNIIPLSIPNAVLINSIAQSIGLHDFYQVGLWNFCEGYNGQGITHCSKPKTLYAFNPVEIIVSELLSGASIALPSDITQPLNLAKLASQWMFGLFITGTVLNFILIFISPLAVSARPPQSIKGWAAVSSSNGEGFKNPGQPPHRRRTFIPFRSIPMLLISFFAALTTIVATVVATVMFIIFANVFVTADPSLDIKAHIGKQMFVFMWIASAFSLFAFILQFCSCCASCCGGHKARKQLKSEGINLYEKHSA
ncbi:hypothetical protein N7495_005570 [Penicillium taxi]|uniref:uncharacterized protein n=1 Tax=Penicillium taxi TaxID=168475 RepID=UPI0025455953|nr:uncharacterized protein N7495_005570 [Penicillium taxi]KAJ5893879.1 hypothetical protein N7495_005570 [Penicillium taxi]